MVKFEMWISVAWVVALAVAAGASPSPLGAAEFRLRLLHTNDLHSRFQQVSKTAGKCSEYEAAQNLCYGGFARVQAALKQEIELADRENVEVLSLNAGDTYQGTVWYSIFKWEVVTELLNMLTMDAMSLGNHEFDDGINGLTPFLNESVIPVLAANIDFTQEPEVLGTQLKKSLTLERGGRKIGIIGYLTPETVTLANTGNSKFLDEIEILTKEAKELKRSQVDIIFAVGHSGYEMDKKIAMQVPDVDVVVGGHSHSFLYSGTPPDLEVPIDTYPVMLTQKSGRKVAMVQAYAFTKYLGKLDLWFDERGELSKAQGNPILLNHEVPEDPDVQMRVEVWGSKLNSTLREKIGKTAVFLDGDSCRFYECNLGNLITDAFVNYGVKVHSEEFWKRGGIAIQQAGGIRASIDVTENNGTITKEDMITTMPFFSPVSLISLKGKHLLEALEWSVTRYDVSHKLGRGEFLQVSGMKVKYDLGKPVGSRVVSARVLYTNVGVPFYSDLNLDEDYKIIMPTFLFRGGDNFTMFKNYGKEILQFEIKDSDLVMNYVTQKEFLYNGLEDRLQVVYTSASHVLKPSLFPVFFILFVYKFLVSLYY